MPAASNPVHAIPLRGPRFDVDGWSCTANKHVGNLHRSRKQAFDAIQGWIIAHSSMPTPKDLCVALGYEPTELALIRFRILWREYFVTELPLLEGRGVITHSKMLAVMQSPTLLSSRTRGDTKARETRLMWFCRHLLDHTDLVLTNRQVNKLAFGRDSPSLPADHYGKLVRAFRDKELIPLLDSLFRLPTRELVTGSTVRVKTLLKQIDRLWIMVSPSRGAPILRAVCDHIVATEKVVPTYERLREILPFVPPNNVKGNGFMPLLKQWRRDRGFPDHLRGTMNASLPRTWDTLVPTLAAPVRRAPHTFLDPRAKPGRYRRYHDEVAALLGRCEDPAIRSSLALAVLSSSGNHARLPMFAAGLSQIIRAGRLTGLTDPRMEETLRAFVTGDLALPEAPDDSGDDGEAEPIDHDDRDADGDDEREHLWSQHKIKDFFRTYRAVSFSQQRYLNDLPKARRKLFQPYMLPRLQDQVFWKAANFNYLAVEAQKRRRKARTDALFPHRGLIRMLPEFRTNLATRLLALFRIEAARAGDGQISLPYDFSLFEDEPHLGPPTRHRFRLWSRAILLKTYRQYDKDDERRHVEPAHRAQYIVEYLGALGDDGSPSTNELWFTDLIRYDAFYQVPNRDTKSEGLLKSFGIARYQYKAMWPMLCASRSLSAALSSLIRDVRKSDPSFRPVFFSPEGLHQMCLYGRAANRILNVTGCRANELQQIHASADCLMKVNVDNRSPAYAFMAIPKLHTDLEPFFIDELSVKFIAELARCITTNSPTNALPRVKGAQNLALHKRTKELPYLFQTLGMEPRAMRDEQIGSLVRFMLHGLLLKTIDGIRFQPGLHDLRHLTGATLRNQGVPLEVIAKMFKQKDLKVTDYYSEPTNSMVVAAMHGLQMAVIGIGPAAGIRKPEELDQQLKEANGVVGALTKVLGGDCTVPSPCAAKFACLGCAGLVPNPTHRPHVQRNKDRLQEDIAVHREQGMLAEVRKDERHIADCDRVLAEMDLQAASLTDASREARA